MATSDGKFFLCFPMKGGSHQSTWTQQYPNHYPWMSWVGFLKEDAVLVDLKAPMVKDDGSIKNKTIVLLVQYHTNCVVWAGPSLCPSGWFLPSFGEEREKSAFFWRGEGEDCCLLLFWRGEDHPLFWISISFLFKSQRMPDAMRHAHARALLVGFCWWVRARALLVGSW